MKRIIVILYLFIVVSYSQTAFSQSVEAFATIDSSSIMIGDQVNMELGVTIPQGFSIQWPLLEDTLSSHIEILKSSAIDTTTLDDLVTFRQRLLITSFDSGYFEIPAIDFNFSGQNDTNNFLTSTNKLYLQVYTPVVDTTQAFKIIKGPVSEPYTFAEIFPWLLLGIVILAIIALVIWYIRKKRKGPSVFTKKAEPTAPPHIIAIQKLEELRLAKVWQQGRLKDYYSELTDITREYMEGRYLFNALEMTTDEIMDELSDRKVNKEITEKLSSTLQLADLVKFAKAIPTGLENDLGFNHCIDFVNETKKTDVAQNNDNQIETDEVK